MKHAVSNATPERAMMVKFLGVIVSVYLSFFLAISVGIGYVIHRCFPAVDLAIGSFIGSQTLIPWLRLSAIPVDRWAKSAAGR